MVLVLEWVPRAAGLAAGPLLLALVVPTLPWMLERRNVQDLYLRRAGEWIRRQQPSGRRVMTTRNMVPFYANGSMVWSPPGADLDSILAEGRVHRPDWLVFDKERLTRRVAHLLLAAVRGGAAGGTDRSGASGISEESRSDRRGARVSLCSRCDERGANGVIVLRCLPSREIAP